MFRIFLSRILQFHGPDLKNDKLTNSHQILTVSSLSSRRGISRLHRFNPTLMENVCAAQHNSAHEEDFARGFTEALIAYTLGRPFGFTDEDLAMEILTAAKAKQYSLSEFVKALVSSEKFKKK